MKILLIVLAALVAVVGGGLYWLGAFGSVKVGEREMGPYSFVYVQEAGTDSGKIAELTEELGSRLEAAGYRQRKPVQVFFAPGRGIQNQIGFFVDRAVGNDVLGAETFFRPIPAQRYMVVRFPYRNGLSYAVGGARAEDALAQHRAANKYAETQAIVVLDGDAILYLQPIERA